MRSVSSRRTSWNPAMEPLCIHSQRPCRNGWQFVCCTGVPVDARMWANTIGLVTISKMH